MANIEKTWKRYKERGKNEASSRMNQTERLSTASYKGISSSGLLETKISSMHKRMKEVDRQIQNLRDIAESKKGFRVQCSDDIMSARINRALRYINEQEKSRKQAKEQKSKKKNEPVLKRIKNLEDQNNPELLKRLQCCEENIKEVYKTLKKKPSLKDMQKKIEDSIGKTLQKFQKVLDKQVHQQMILKREIRELNKKATCSTSQSTARTHSSLKIPIRSPKTSKRILKF